MITGLTEADQPADIALTVKGPVRDVMQLINSPPLGYAKAVGLDPNSLRRRGDDAAPSRLPAHRSAEDGERQGHRGGRDDRGSR